ncbi:phage portal protein [Rummeliibacillus sp. POC4]|uniref:phage portal protein n=1 Tax=Rummeliibacillus sp. POC4 TaxID=2305899 RepID=UPI000E6714C6|nr:phage portal protein [Rummeliibacillus sp. POC4]RIJ63615.1 phage portal protein [Rummeliibacillus sp. POC4]
MASWWNKAVGEMSNLRSKLFGSYGIMTGRLGSGYKLDSTKVDYEKTKALYYNTDDNYKLGAGFAKSVINSKVSFMGIPSFKSEDKNAQEVLDDFVETNASNMQRTTRDALRDGDCYVWVTREEEKDASLYPEQAIRLIYNVIPPGQVADIIREPLTGIVEEYKLVSYHEWKDENDYSKRSTIIQRIRRGERIVEVDGDLPPGVEEGTFTTPWDFIPIVHFKNEGDEGVYGQSELEVIEPYMKAYHDVMLHAMQGSKMHSTPRLKLKVKDVSKFLKNNFGVKDANEFAKNGGTINLDGKELLFLQGDDDASFIEVKSATGDAQVLLKLLFYCIVDASETPEFVFGVHTPSSLSSVKEQMPILIRSIERKREHFADSWQRLARIVLAMTGYSDNFSFDTYKTTLSWVNIDYRTGQEISQELLNIVNALNIALNNNMVSEVAAVNYLSRYIDTMNEWQSEDGENEQDRIMNTRLNRMKLEDTQYLEEQSKSIGKTLRNSGDKS